MIVLRHVLFPAKFYTNDWHIYYMPVISVEFPSTLIKELKFSSQKNYCNNFIRKYCYRVVAVNF